MTVPIEVVAIRPLDGTGTIKGYVDLKIGSITIRGAKIIQQENQKAWLGMPGIKTNHGWQNVIEIHSKELRQRINDFVIAHWDNQGIPVPTRGQGTWDTVRDLPAGQTEVHRNERQDPRSERIEELAAELDRARPGAALVTAQPEPCTCRVCVAMSLSRALQHIDRGQPEVAAHIISLAMIDLARDAEFIKTATGKAMPICEYSKLSKIARMFRKAGVMLEEGVEE
jgi:DNA-binding cell septation regulator SpoVG